MILPSADQWPQYDVFISHASADKEYVDPLVRELEKAGISVWLDSKRLTWGQDLRPSIDRGLSNSRFGIVVLSPAFLQGRKWTEYELNALFAREESDRKIVLPIWHEVTRQDLLSYSASLADRFAVDSVRHSHADIAEKLLELLGRAKERLPRREKKKAAFRDEVLSLLERWSQVQGLFLAPTLPLVDLADARRATEVRGDADILALAILRKLYKLSKLRSVVTSFAIFTGEGVHLYALTHDDELKAFFSYSRMAEIAISIETRSIRVPMGVGTLTTNYLTLGSFTFGVGSLSTDQRKEELSVHDLKKILLEIHKLAEVHADA